VETFFNVLTNRKLGKVKLLDLRVLAKLQWLQNASQLNGLVLS